MATVWPIVPTEWPQAQGFPTGRPLQCESSAVDVALQAQALTETFKILSADSRATDFQLIYFRTAAGRKIDQMVEWMNTPQPSNFRT